MGDSPWNFLPPDAEVQDDDDYHVVMSSGSKLDEPDVNTEYMIDVIAPRSIWPFRRKVKVLLWSYKDRKWHLVARFVTLHAAAEYAQFLSTKIVEAKRHAAKRRPTTH